MQYRILTMNEKLINDLLNAGTDTDRRHTQSKVDQYAGIMMRGRWNTNNGEAIKITGKVNGKASSIGKRLDGQHRALAAKKVLEEIGKPVKLAILEGVDPESQGTLDQGNTRKLHHFLQSNNVDRADALAPVFRLLYSEVENNNPLVAKVANVDRLSEGELFEYCMQNFPDLPAFYGSIARDLARIDKKKIGSRAWYAWFFYRAFSVDRELARDLLEYLSTGSGARNKTMTGLREWLIERHRFDELSNKRKAAKVLAGLTFAWNAMRSGRYYESSIGFDAALNRKQRKIAGRGPKEPLPKMLKPEPIV